MTHNVFLYSGVILLVILIICVDLHCLVTRHHLIATENAVIMYLSLISLVIIHKAFLEGGALKSFYGLTQILGLAIVGISMILRAIKLRNAMLPQSYVNTHDTKPHDAGAYMNQQSKIQHLS